MIYIIAGFLAVFAVQLMLIVRTKNTRVWEVTVIIISDIAWVVGSIALLVLYYRTMTPTAVILVNVVAVAVLMFAVMQIRRAEAVSTTENSRLVNAAMEARNGYMQG